MRVGCGDREVAAIDVVDEDGERDQGEQVPQALRNFLTSVVKSAVISEVGTAYFGSPLFLDLHG